MEGLRIVNALLACAFIALTGCTTIKITDANGVVRVERGFGFASIEVPPDSGVVVTKVRSLGYVSGPMGHSVGINWSEILKTDESCRVNVWVNDKTDLDRLYNQLKSVHSVCFLSF